MHRLSKSGSSSPREPIPAAGTPSFPTSYGSPSPPNFRAPGPSFPLGPPGPSSVTARPIPGRTGHYGAATSFYDAGTAYNPVPGSYGGGYHPTYL